MSRKKEQRAWDTLQRNNLGSTLTMFRIENLLNEGMPDVLVHRKGPGDAIFLELKALDEWPARAATAPLRGAFEKGQVPFAKAWVSRGGRAYILLRVGLLFLLLPPKIAGLELVEMTTEELKRNAVCTGTGRDVIKFLEGLAKA